MGDAEEKNPEHSYSMKGIPIHAYLTQNGEFNWIPTSQACTSKKQTREILRMLEGLPEDRRAVWASRLDINQTKTKCPIIHDDNDLRTEFDNFCSTYNSSKLRKTKPAKRGETPK